MKRTPVNGTFELTGRCNLKCPMCLVRIDEQRMRAIRRSERTGEEWIRLAREAYGAGTVKLLITGGEPLMHPDFHTIYEVIAGMGFLLTVYTNGVLIGDKVMELLHKWPPHIIGVTIYGASNETYAKVTGQKDGYDRLIAGLEQLEQLPSMLDIRTTIIRDNLSDLNQMKELVRQRYGPEKILHISSNVFRQVRDGIANPVECRLTKEENSRLSFGSLWDILEHRIKEGKPVKIKKPDGLGKPKPKEYWNCCHDLFEHCGAGVNSYSIAWDGTMYPCQMIGTGGTLPLEVGFMQAWEQLSSQYPPAKAIEQCQDCPDLSYCDLCPAARMTETGDWFGIPEYFCGQAKYIGEKMKQYGLFFDE